MSKKWLVIGGGIVLLSIGVYFLAPMSFIRTLKDTVSEVAGMRYEIVVTEAAQEKGLGGRAEIPDNYGMLFVLDKPKRVGVWMKDMLTPIDILWLSDNGTVILIDSYVNPASYPHVFYPPQPVSYVLETKAGYADKHTIAVGSNIRLPAPYGNRDK